MNKSFISLMLVFVMLISGVLPVFADGGITMHLNGNYLTGDKEIDVNNGVFSATTEGSGLFAIAMYKNDELVKLQLAEDDEDLSYARLNMVVDSDSTYYSDIKIFRFDNDGNPVEVNKILKPTEKDEAVRIYFNETFDNNESRYAVNGSTLVLSDGKLKVNGDSGFGFGAMSVRYPERYTIIEADFELDDKDSWPNCTLVATYSEKAPHTFLRIRGDGLYTADAYSTPAPYVKKDKNLPSVKDDGKFHIGIIIDLESDTYSVWLDGEKLSFYYETDKKYMEDIPMGSRITDAEKTEGFSIYVPYTKADNTIIYADNIRAYSGNKFLDIGNAIPNVHNTDIQPDSIAHDYYERPEASEIAKKAIESGHPRVMINAEKVQQIKNSEDENIKAWKEQIIEQANAALETPAASWEEYNPSDGSLDGISECLDLVMNLGLAYQLEDDEAIKQKYADRAYAQAEVLMNFTGIHDGVRVPYDWNSDSYLDVGEISAIISICYDWMYDAWTKEQKKAFVDSIMRSSIDISYKAYYNQRINNGGKTGTGWWKNTNNWNAVCNGGVLTAALAFMEEDIYRCSQLAEGTIRGFEYLLPKFAPQGAWAEGTGYWSYTLKYLTIACSTLENACGTLYGLDKTTGLKETQTYALDLEGATGTFAFGDGGSNHIKSPYMYYWAKVYKDPSIGGAAKYSMDTFGFEPDAFDLIFYEPQYVAENYNRPYATYREGTEVVTLASGHNKNDTVIAITGGKGVATSHDHLDSGSITVDMNGIRIIGDTGAEHYDALQYFATNRYWYYKARPEGHNVFVINPDNLYDTDGTTYYHGQSKTANSVVGDTFNETDKTATMDLSEAYARDASKATRKISLDGESVVIEDEIELSSDGNLIEWYYHFKDIISYVYDGETLYQTNENGGTLYCEVTIDGQVVKVKYQDYEIDGNGKVERKGTYKEYKITFDSETSFNIEQRDAERNPYDASVIKEFRRKGTMSYDYYTYFKNTSDDKYTKNGSTYPMDKIVVKMADIPQGTVKLKTTIEAVE